MNILLADDHVLFREGFAMLLQGLYPNTKIYHADCWQSTFTALETSPIHLALVDLDMPSSQDWKIALESLTCTFPTTRVCVVSATNTPYIIKQAFQTGINGYIPKLYDISEIQVALNKIVSGKIYIPPCFYQKHTSSNRSALLTPRQQQILAMVQSGKSNKQIADKIQLKESTIKRHIFNICQLLQVNSRTEAVATARKMGLLFSF